MTTTEKLTAPGQELWTIHMSQRLGNHWNQYNNDVDENQQGTELCNICLNKWVKHFGVMQNWAKLTS